jgi:hypothetical protein
LPGHRPHQSRRLIALLTLLATVLGACSGSEVGSGFGFGQKKAETPTDSNPFPARYKTEIADFMRTYLNNPTKVKDSFIGEPVMKPVAGQPRYITCVRYNPRDDKNVYLGSQSNLAIFLNGRLNQFLPASPEMCGGLNYQRYPDIENMVP